MIFYELKISYTRQTGEDNPKAVKETYLVEGLTAADVEAVSYTHLTLPTICSV